MQGNIKIAFDSLKVLTFDSHSLIGTLGIPFNGVYLNQSTLQSRFARLVTKKREKEKKTEKITELRGDRQPWNSNKRHKSTL